MSTTESKSKTAKLPKGGAFILEDASPEQVFTPEDFTDEHKMIRQTVEDFVNQEVLPVYSKLEDGGFQQSIALMKKAAEIGLAGLDVPAHYGGMELDIVSSMLVVQGLSKAASFSTTFGAHTSIGTLPIVFFGTEAQKKKYLPPLVKAEMIAAYALTEPGSGSDALAAKCRAELSADKKHFILNGTKMWITNAGFADLFIVFAQVDGDKFTGFIVEKGYPGVSTGAEEKKMGLHGSSTRILNLDNVPVPVDNLLGEIGKGHKIAFNCLNIGRFKLGSACIGGSRNIINESVAFAKQRHQFGAPIASFGAIKHKIGQMAVTTWVGESMVFRTAGLIDGSLEGVDRLNNEEVLKAIEEYVIECSTIKVLGSEILGYVADEGVQIHGGLGYSSEYKVEHAYRDARINRIFEGTNEINRLLIPAMLIKRAMRGTLPLVPAAQKVLEEILSLPQMEMEEETLLVEEKKLVKNAKKLALLSAGVAFQRFMEALKDEQEVLTAIANLVMEAFAMESALLRALKLVAAKGEEACKIHLDIVRLYIHEAIQRCGQEARRVVSACAEGDALRTQIVALNRFSKVGPMDTIKVRRGIAEHVIAAGRYDL